MISECSSVFVTIEILWGSIEKKQNNPKITYNFVGKIEMTLYILYLSTKQLLY